jgi:hypothetical protein
LGSLSQKPAAVQSPIDNHIQYKLSYEWKNIYRRLAQNEDENSCVSPSKFNAVCVSLGVMLNYDELKRLTNKDGKINY